MKISELVIACFNLEGMFTFYKNVFNISFEELKIPQGIIYNGFINEIQITLCPATMAGIEVKDNRHQLTLLVDDIKKILDYTILFKGSIMQELVESKDFLLTTIRDVDGNSIVLKQATKWQ